MATRAVLYTPAILELAAGLSAFPPDPALGLTGSARSPSCGSTLTVRLAVDPARRITRIGVAAHACAIGQAAASVFARAAPGRVASEIAAAEIAIAAWLAGAGPMPAWPGLDLLAPAAAYPGRHGAILLAWRAAASALSSGD